MRMFRPLRRVIRRSPLIAVFVLLGLAGSQLVYAAPPTNESFDFAPANPVVGQNVTFTANPPIDPDPGDTFTYQWDFDYGGSGTFEAQLSGPDAQVTRPAPNDPTWNVALRVVDAAGEQSPVSDRVVPVSQPANQPPSTPTIAGPTSTGVR